MLKELKKLNEDIERFFDGMPLKDFGIFVFRKSPYCNIRKEYDDTKEGAIERAKQLADKFCNKEYAVKVIQRGENRIFNMDDKPLWCSCNKEEK